MINPSFRNTCRNNRIDEFHDLDRNQLQAHQAEQSLKLIYCDSRSAVREFTTEPVNEAVLRQLIDAAVQAPSAVNQQPWLFSLVGAQAFQHERTGRTHICMSPKTAAASVSRKAPKINWIS
jgi:hypothetical protein